MESIEEAYRCTIKYKIVSAISTTGLEEQINKLSEEGWNIRSEITTTTIPIMTIFGDKISSYGVEYCIVLEKAEWTKY